MHVMATDGNHQPLVAAQGRYADEQVQDLWHNSHSTPWSSTEQQKRSDVPWCPRGPSTKELEHERGPAKSSLSLTFHGMHSLTQLNRVEQISGLWGMVPVLPKLLEQGTPEQRADRDYVLKAWKIVSQVPWKRGLCHSVCYERFAYFCLRGEHFGDLWIFWISCFQSL